MKDEVRLGVDRPMEDREYVCPHQPCWEACCGNVLRPRPRQRPLLATACGRVSQTVACVLIHATLPRTRVHMHTGLHHA